MTIFAMVHSYKMIIYFNLKQSVLIFRTKTALLRIHFGGTSSNSAGPFRNRTVPVKKNLGQLIFFANFRHWFGIRMSSIKQVQMPREWQ